MVLNDISKWQNIYDELMNIEKEFQHRYLKTEPKFYEKTCIELLVELGEFVNETKCFNYWTIKKPNKEKVLEELVDCITVTLILFDKLQLNLNNLSDVKHYKNNNLLEVINYVFAESSKLLTNLNETTLKNIFVNLIYISEILGLTEKEIFIAFERKIAIVKERLNTNY